LLVLLLKGGATCIKKWDAALHLLVIARRKRWFWPGAEIGIMLPRLEVLGRFDFYSLLYFFLFAFVYS
jgi:hypothetical protein